MKKNPISYTMLVFASITLFSTQLHTANPEESQPASPLVWGVTPDLEISELQPGIWIHTSWMTLNNGARFPSNGLAGREDHSRVLIDTAWGEESTRHLLAWIKQELKLPVSAVIATHAHSDRMGGAPVLAEQGIPLDSHPSGFDMATRQGWPEPNNVGDLMPGDTVPFGTVEIFYPGAAHTQDNLMVWLPQSRLLAGGCAVKSATAKTMGNIADADLEEWPASIRRASDTYPEAEWVLPGHGAIGGRELLLHTTQLIEETE